MKLNLFIGIFCKFGGNYKNMLFGNSFSYLKVSQYYNFPSVD